MPNIKKIVIKVIVVLFVVQFWACKTIHDDILSEGEELISLADETFEVSSTVAREYAQKALEYSLEHNDIEIEAKSYYQLTRTYFATNEFTRAIEYAQLSEKLLLMLKDNYTLAFLYNTWGNGYFMMRDNEKSDFYSNKAIEMAEHSSNLQVLITQYYMKALKSHETKDSFIALKYLLKALEYNDDSEKVAKSIQRCYSLLGTIYSEFGIRDKALDYYKQSIEHAEKENLNRQLIYLYHNISGIYNTMNYYDSSYIYCKKSLLIAESTNVIPFKAIAFRTLAGYYSSIKQHDSAIICITNAIEIAEKINYHNLYNFYLTAGEIYYKIGDYNNALFYSKEAFELTIEANNPLSIQSAIKLMADIYNEHQMYEFASFYYNKYIEGDSLRAKNFNLIQEELARFAEQAIIKQTQSQYKEITYKRNILVYILFICTFFIGCLIFVVRLLINQRNRIKLINKELSDHKDELELLIDYKNKLLDDKELQYSNLCNNMFNGAVFRMEFSVNDINISSIIFLSSGWNNLTGQTDESIIFFDENVINVDREHLLNSITKAVQTCSKLDTTFRYKKDNEILWLHVRAQATKSAEERVFLDGYLVDETDQKKFEELLFDAKEKAEESDRLKSAFLNNISHEIRTPMNGIVGFSNLILSEQIPEHEKKEFLTAINENCYQLLQIINDIVELSKIETGQLTLKTNEISLCDIEKDITQYVFPIYKEKYPQLNFITDPSFNTYKNTKLETDRSSIQMIFDYLVGNAGKFTPEGKIVCGIIMEKNYIRFYVSDTGIGIEPQYFDSIFDNFTKLNPQMNSGTGLGLPIVKRLTAILGGKIWLESEINKGSTFYFSIPIS